MADRPRDDDWWLASDGKWYPPELHPAEGGEGLPAAESTRVPRGLTRAVSIGLGATSVLFAIASFFGIRLAPLVRSGAVDLTEVGEVASSAEVAYGAWTVFAVFAFIVTGVMVIAWVYTTSKALDARGPEGRRWRGGWTIWSWFIPLGNLVLPKLVFNEIERNAQEPYTGSPIAGRWQQRTRTQIGDLWWGMWIVGVVLTQVSSLVVPAESPSADAMGTSVFVNSIAFLALAIAGGLLALVVRRIELFSRR